MKNEKSLTSYLLLLGIGIVWGGQFLFNAQAIEYFPPTTIAATRVLIGAITLSIITHFVPEQAAPSQKGKWSFGLLFAAIAFFESVIPLFLITWGQQHVSSSVTAVMVGSVPVVTLLLSMFMSKRKNFSLFSGLSVILGFVGIIVLVNPGSGSFSSNTMIYQIAIFLGVVGFSIGLNLMERTPHGAPIRSARNIMWLASVPLVIAALIIDKPWALTWGFSGTFALFILGIVGSGLAYLMYATLTQRSGSVFTSLSNFLVPAVGVILGVAVRGEAFGSRQGWALALIIAALLVNEMRALIKMRQPA